MKTSLTGAKQDAMSVEVALAVFAAAGVTAGVIISLKFDSETLNSVCGIEQKLSAAAGGEGVKLFLNSLFGPGLFLCAAFLCGFCAVGQPAELLLSAFRGLGLGVCVRGVYQSRNIPVAAACFLPYAILSTCVLIIALRDAFSLSMRYLGLTVTSENRLGIKNEIHDYITRFMIYAAALAALSVLDVILAGRLGGI